VCDKLMVSAARGTGGVRVAIGHLQIHLYTKHVYLITWAIGTYLAGRGSLCVEVREILVTGGYDMLI
jgi:hypothetical protein